MMFFFYLNLVVYNHIFSLKITKWNEDTKLANLSFSLKIMKQNRIFLILLKSFEFFRTIFNSFGFFWNLFNSFGVFLNLQESFELFRFLWNVFKYFWFLELNSDFQTLTAVNAGVATVYVLFCFVLIDAFLKEGRGYPIRDFA